MNLASKKGLVLAGIVYILSIITYFVEDNFINTLYDIFLLIWICLMILMLFNKVPSLLIQMIKKHPKTTTYIASFGVITYFWIFYTIFILILGFSTDINENSFIAHILVWFSDNTQYIIFFMTMFAVAISFHITQRKKLPN